MTLPKFFPVTIKAAPRIGNLYWCDFHSAEYIHLPEMWKTRPILIVSRQNFLRGKVTALPLSTEKSNLSNKFGLKLPKHITDQIDGLDTWILCDHIVTVSTSRLRQIHGKVPRITGQELDEILKLMLKSIGGTSNI